jgi:hypothetical protein
LIKQRLINILIIAVFCIGIVFSILPAQNKVEAAAIPIVNGNTVSITTQDAYIEATPATLTSSGWVEVLFWTRSYSGQVDVVYGFNGLDNVKVTQSAIWESYTQEDKTVKTDWNVKDKPTTVSMAYQGSKTWNVVTHKSVQKGEIQKTRVWIDIPFKGKETVTGKYNIGIKPSSLNLQDAKDQGKLWLLDPWYSSSWGYRKELTCYGSNAGVQTNYQKLIRVYAASVGADIPENLAQYTTNDDAQSAVYGANWSSQTFTSEATATAKKVWVKLLRVLTPGVSYTCAIYSTHGADNHPDASLCSGTITANYVSTTADWYEFDMGAGTALTSGTKYAVVLSSAGGDAANYLQWRWDSTAGAYSGGSDFFSNDSGVNWTEQATIDLLFQVITSTTGATPLRVDTEAHCQADFDDLRFTDSTGATLLDYFIQNKDTCVANGYADCWVELNTIAQMTGTNEHTHYYLYYGNSGASQPDTNQNMGEATFPFFDHFDEGYPITKWAGTTGSGSVAGSVLTYTSTGAPQYIVSSGSITAPYALLGSYTYLVQGGAGTEAEGLFYGGGANIDKSLVGFGMGTGINTAILVFDNAGASTLVATTNVLNAWTYIHLTERDSMYTNVYLNGSLATNAPVYGTPNTANTQYIEIYADTSNTLKTDWMFICGQVVTQPLWGTAGAELALIAPTVVTGLCTGTGNTWAVLNGNVTVLANQDGTSFNSTVRGFNYGITGAYGSTSSTTGSYPIGTYAILVTGLQPATTYHYRAFASVPAITGVGLDATFTTAGATFCHSVFETVATDNISIYGIYWGAQTFTTPAGMPWTVKRVAINARKVGAPTGDVVVSIYRATAGLPVGQVLTSSSLSGTQVACTGTFASSLLDTIASWYTVEMATEVSLEPNTQYALVVGAPTLVAAAPIQWRNVAIGGYTGGTASTSANSGTDWVAVTPDQLFRICGNPCLAIQDVKVFESYRETGDWLITVRYIDTYPPYYDTYDVRKYFIVEILDSVGTVKGSNVIPAWGNRVANIYFSAASAASLTYGGAYSIRLYGTFTGNPYTEYYLQSTDWAGSDLINLDSWVITSAAVIGTYYSTTLTTYITGIGEVLNATSAGVFSAGIAALSEIRPNIFNISANVIPNPTPAPNTQALQTHYVWQTAVGPQAVVILTSIGNLLGGVSGDQIGQFLIFIAWALVAGFAYPPGHTMAAFILDAPLLILSIWVGFTSVATMGILLFLMIIVLLWQFVLKGAS